MRKILLLLIFISVNSFGQSATIIKNDGTKISADQSSIDINLTGRKVYYNRPGSKKQESVKYKELQYALFNGLKFEPMDLKKGKFSAYFVLAESKDKKLVGMAISGSMTYFELIVLDANNKVLDMVDYMITNTKRHREQRMRVSTMVREHFADCPKLIDRLAMYEFPIEQDKKVTMINGFIETPAYIKCE